MTDRRPRDFSKDAKIAALLCIVFEIPHEHQQAMHEGHVLSLAEWDHYPKRYADGGSNHFSNAKPLLKAAHRQKTAKIDVPEIAKGRRIAKALDRHKIVLEIKAGVGSSRHSVLIDQAIQKIRARRFAKGRKLQSRGFQRRRS